MKDAPFESIGLRKIRAWGRHGANLGEQDVAQPLDISLNLVVDVHAARTSDELADTVDYARLHARVVELVATERHRLLERLGESILCAVMEDKRIAVAGVTIEKPELLDGATPYVSLQKMRMSAMAKRRKHRNKPK